jgi:hypothetical protein
MMTEELVDAPLRQVEQQCSTAPVETGGGCPLDANGLFSNCIDIYSICGGIGRFPIGTCTRRSVQRYLIGTTVIAVNHITFRVTRTAPTTTQNEAELRTRLTCRGEVEFAPDSRVVVLG